MMTPLHILMMLAALKGCIFGEKAVNLTIGALGGTMKEYGGTAFNSTMCAKRRSLKDAYVENVLNWTIGADRKTMRWELSLLQYEFIGNLEGWCDAAIGEGWSNVYHTKPGEFKFFPLYGSNKIRFQVRAWFEATIVLSTVPRLTPPFIELVMGTLEYYKISKDDYLNNQDTVLLNQYVKAWSHYEGKERELNKNLWPDFECWVSFYGLDRKKYLTHELLWRNDYVGLNHTTNVTFGEALENSIINDKNLFDKNYVLTYIPLNYSIDPPIPFAYFGVGATDDPDADWKFQDMYHVKSFFEDSPLQVSCAYYLEVMSYCSSFPDMLNNDVESMFWLRCWPKMIPDESREGRIVSNELLIIFVVLLMMVS